MEAFRKKGSLRNAKQSKTNNNNNLVEEGQRKGLKTKHFYWKGALREAVGRRMPEIKSKKEPVGTDRSPTEC